jgi:hypothetical protein
VIPGGAYCSTALVQALARDRVAAAHYQGFDAAAARIVHATPGMRMYASYRIADAIFWTAKPVALREGETLLTDGVTFIRARCGNRLSPTPRLPVGPTVELDSIAADEGEAQWRDSALEGPRYATSQLAPDIFPDPLVDGSGRLTSSAPEAAAQIDGPASDGPAEDSTLSGYAQPAARAYFVAYPATGPVGAFLGRPIAEGADVPAWPWRAEAPGFASATPVELTRVGRFPEGPPGSPTLPSPPTPPSAPSPLTLTNPTAPLPIQPRWPDRNVQPSTTTTSKPTGGNSPCCAPGVNPPDQPVEPAAVPEPAALTLTGVGLLVLLARRLRRKT